ncbi:hypothetical protein [Massilia sp. S19_KUP03_FR1]|uniref:hypothetical protein n=1 Tax=Massilia sp. S19_KUP03_FR1 TaxID=3025503 RepID=UPI002FCD9001
MTAHRQSALLLHGLAPADQRWILAQVDQADARVLRGHLRELKALGIPADPALAPSSAPATGGEPAASIARASAAALLLAVADEPAWLVAQLLALRPWPWRGAFLDALDPARRAALAATVPAPLAPGAQAALLSALAARLAPGSAGNVRAAPGVWQRLRGGA